MKPIAAGRGLFALLGMLLGNAALAEVKDVAADGFLLEHKQTLASSPAQVFAAIGQIDQWWSPAHTWSGDAGNLRLDLRVGGCFCERWSEGEAEHLRVAHVQADKIIRLLGGLGPLQGMALDGSLEWRMQAADSGTELSLSYRVSGDSLHRLADLAPVVDGVLGEQFKRLGYFVSTGQPESASAPAADR